jgi:hypothetical protein
LIMNQSGYDEMPLPVLRLDRSPFRHQQFFWINTVHVNFKA